MPPLIAAHDLSVARGARRVLDHVDLGIEPGEIVTIVGPNGSGKSSLLQALVGAIPPLSGRIERAAGLRLGYVPQVLHIEPTMPMPVERFLSLPRSPGRAARDAALRDVGLDPDIRRQEMTRLSGGQFQRVLLARAILTRPQILILDEATRGLDQPGTAAFYRLVEKLRQKLGCAVLMVSHDLHVVMSASDRVICLNGHICCHGSPRAVASAPEYRALFGAGTQGTLALYQHHHDHDHEHDHDHAPAALQAEDARRDPA